MNKPEILAPAGSIKAMEAAIKAGADAVYMGGTMFGARAYADNPGQEELVDAIRYVHFYDKKLYLTLNTLLKEEEMGLLYDYVTPYYKAGLDGIIIQDPGVFSFIKRYFPALPLHASTQMNITGVAAARLLKEAGASRIVPARELTLAEIRRMKQETGLEIETFVHGALCYCYSGRCLMSSIIGGRSGNRGRCAQPCRLPYEVSGKGKPSHVLSPKDLCTIFILPELIEAGIDSFKIEGRMKNPEYVASIVSVYRKYMDRFLKNPDRPYRVEDEDFQLLLEAYNRGGFTEGYYKQHNGPDMMSMERPNHRGISVGRIEKIKDGSIFFHPNVDIHKGDGLELVIPGRDSISLTSPMDCKRGSNLSLKARQVKNLRLRGEILRTGNPWQKKQLADSILTPVKKRKLSGRAEFIVGEPARLRLWLAEEQGTKEEEPVFTTEGDIVLKAEDRPITAEQIKKPLLQTGTSRFEFNKLEIVVEEGAFLPVGAIKKLRREGLESFSTYLEERKNRDWKKVPVEKVRATEETDRKRPEFRASAEDKEHLMYLLSRPEMEGIYVPLEEVERKERQELAKKAHALQKKLYYALPRVFRNKEQDEYDRLWDAFLEERPSGFLIRNIDELAWIKEKLSQQELWRMEIILDDSLYAYNREARQVYGSIMKMTKNQVKSKYTLPLELNKKELGCLSDADNELILYGRIPLMVSAQCVSKNIKGCVKQPGYLEMKDRYQKSFIVRRHCRYCYNTIWNGIPLSLHGMKKELEGLYPDSLRLHFTVEQEKEMEQIIRLFYEEWNNIYSASEIKGEFTRGHYKRGIE